jgi:uncharacterized protein (DUF1501 family)
MPSILSRRNFLKYGAAALGGAVLPLRGGWSQIQEDHFLYVLFLDSAADFTYMFDARPLEMTKNKLLVNHMEQEPTLWTGLNGQKCWASAATKALHPYKQDFTIVNGVFVQPTDMGHPGSIDVFFSGNPFGGPSFLPWINSLNAHLAPTSLDGIKKNGSQLFTTDPNHSSLIEMSGSDVASLVNKLNSYPNLSQYPDAMDFVLQRMQAGAQLNPQGQWSQGSDQLYQNLQKANRLAQELVHLNLSQLDLNPETQFMQLFANIASKRLGRTALEVSDSLGFQNPQENFFFDLHGFTSVGQVQSLYLRTAEKIANILAFFKNTAFDHQRSLMDVTTLVVATEFGRTMRQQFDFATSGTDHNPFCNSYLLAGKGIRTGMVVGASDFQHSQEPLSPAHLQLDPHKLCLVAKPFDFTTESPLDVLPTIYQEEHYLTVGSVVNTLLHLFSVPQKHHRRRNEGAEPYPILKSLLK